MEDREFTERYTIHRMVEQEFVTTFIPFYLRNGFVPLNDEDADEPTRLLYFDLNDLDED